jgi:hypothetical protein
MRDAGKWAPFDNFSWMQKLGCSKRECPHLE